MKRRQRAASRGFTLLEVLVAIAILGLGLTVILSSQVGLFSSTTRGEHLTEASNLMRCKMSELELMVAQKGFSLTDENDEGPCCDQESEGYRCTWKLERVELPPMPDASLENAATSSSASPFGSAGLSLGGLNGPGGLGTPLPGMPPTGPAGAAAPMGPLGALANISATQGASLGDKATPASVMQQLGSTSGAGLEGMVMGFVYPSLKPMLEASIRRVTVKITWKDGQRKRDLEVVQFLTRPQEGMLGTTDQIGLDATTQGLQGLMGLPSTPGATGTTTGIK